MEYFQREFCHLEHRSITYQCITVFGFNLKSTTKVTEGTRNKVVRKDVIDSLNLNQGDVLQRANRQVVVNCN